MFGGGIGKTVPRAWRPDPQLAIVTTSSPEALIPAEHPIRTIRPVVDAVPGHLNTA